MQLKWLNDLEKQVKAVAKELESRRKENASLKTRIEALEAELATAKEASSSDWEKEREQVRERVEKLATTLEKLL